MVSTVIHEVDLGARDIAGSCVLKEIHGPSLFVSC